MDKRIPKKQTCEGRIGFGVKRRSISGGWGVGANGSLANELVPNYPDRVISPSSRLRW